MAETSTKETLGFQTEVSQLLKLMVHSLYSNKEIFLRELISNGSDACDKLRFEALTDPGLFESDPDLRIRIEVDRDARTITVSDNGIGLPDGTSGRLDSYGLLGMRERAASIGATEGAERAFIGDNAPSGQKATAFGLYHMVVGLAALPGAFLFGALWQWWGEPAAFFSAASLGLLSTLALLSLSRNRVRQSDADL